MVIKDLERVLEYVTDKVLITKNICFGYILFSIIEVILVIFNPDIILERLKIKKVNYITVMNLIHLHLVVLIGFIKCFIKMAEK